MDSPQPKETDSTENTMANPNNIRYTPNGPLPECDCDEVEDCWICKERHHLSFFKKCDEAVANRQPKEEYDDMGVLCRYTEEDGWYAIEDHCVTCGYRCDECECEEGEEEWVYPCEECDGRPCECKSK